MSGKAKPGQVKSRSRTPEERRRTARKQSRTYRSTAPGPTKVERKTRVSKAAKPAKSRQPRQAPAMPRLGKRRALALVLALVLVGLVVFGFADSHFYVHAADIRGVQYSPMDQIYQQADVNGCTLAESPNNLPDGRVQKRFVRVCPDSNGKNQVVD